MDDLRLGRLVRALRQERRWRQSDLGRRAGVDRTVVSEIELGRASEHRLGTLRAVLGAFGGGLDLSIRGLGVRAERLLDEHHARLVGATAAWLTTLGWRVQAEVSYSEWGERGSIDLLALHASTGNLLVIEIKTELVSIEATIRKHDEKTRLGRIVADRRLGWRPTAIGRLLVLPDDRTQRRRVVVHHNVLDLAYPERNVRVRAWCRSPSGSGAFSGLMFLTDDAPGRTTARRGRRERVRIPRADEG